MKDKPKSKKALAKRAKAVASISLSLRMDIAAILTKRLAMADCTLKQASDAAFALGIGLKLTTIKSKG